MPGCNLDPDGAQHPDRFISSRSPVSNSLSPNQTNEIRFLVVRTTKKAICKPQNAAECWCFVRCEGNMAKRDVAVHDRKVTAGFFEFSKSLVCTAMLTLYSPLSARAYNMESLRPAPSHQDCHCSSRLFLDVGCSHHQLSKTGIVSRIQSHQQDVHAFSKTSKGAS